MKAEAAKTLKAFFFVELPIYAVLVIAYFFLVLHFLAGWLKDLEDRHLTIYALVAIALIIGQAVVLESITTGLLRLFRGGRSE